MQFRTVSGYMMLRMFYDFGDIFRKKKKLQIKLSRNHFDLEVHVTYNIYMLLNSMKQKYNKLYSTISFVVKKSLFRD